MQAIWDKVYCNKVEHYITLKGAVFHVVRNPSCVTDDLIAATAIMIITTFFIQDTDFHEFATAMLYWNCYLFSENKDTDYKMWTGIWKSLFVLQVFATRFNFVAGCVPIPELDSEEITACSTCSFCYCCGSFTLYDPQKNVVVLKTDSGMTWEVIIPDGESFSFNVQMWGKMTRKLLKPIMALSHGNFMKIVEGAQCYIKNSAKGKGRSTRSGVSKSENDKFRYLFGFC
ncbi:hypothetical protein SCLCIDRAFT_118320 [Scleroderma citrinum Foug A]|uniref:Uncharacterized protein n=1 Tax=Scleroderma citrinum Foug A TaxID=1036808 RepID=A0A0C3E4T4_9AGAM|nr:hypothetical protein SCLCIDRAFT_118320 [Scleroderma citrinum Foug A]